MKRIMSLMVMLTMLLACCPALAGTAAARYAVVANPEPSSRLNLRQSPSRSSQSLGMYMNGVVVEVLSDDGGDWLAVRVGSGAGSRTGYMMRDFLSETDMGRIVPAMVQTEVQVTGQMETQGVYGYAADGSAVEIARLWAGMPVTVLGLSDQEAHIQFGGVTAFIDPAAVGMGGLRDLRPLAMARLEMGGKSVLLEDKGALATLTTMLTGASPRGYRMSGCGFTARLTLWLDSGDTVQVDLATDSCCIFRYNGYDYRYPGADNSVLYGLFGVSLW